MASKTEGKQDPLKTQAMVMIVLLTLQYLLGMAVNLYVKFPEKGNIGQYWAFAKSQLVLDVHMLVGASLLLSSIALFIRSLRQNSTVWKAPSSVGVLAILAAVIAGISFV